MLNKREQLSEMQSQKAEVRNPALPFTRQGIRGPGKSQGLLPAGCCAGPNVEVSLLLGELVLASTHTLPTMEGGRQVGT